MTTSLRSSIHLTLLLAALAITAALYWPGLQGGFLFDDYPNIVDNHNVQPVDAKFSSLVAAALSSPSSQFKRPLASLSFALNYLATGLDPFWMKLTNLVIHLLNGLCIYALARALLTQASQNGIKNSDSHSLAAALIATCWLLLPINLTAVLYVVQRMESLANLFVLLGLIGYVNGRRRMLHAISQPTVSRRDTYLSGFLLCCVSLTLPTAGGLLAKETAAMLPLYAALIEWILFRFHRQPSEPWSTKATSRDPRIITLFLIVLALPMALGLAWLVPGLLKPQTWAVRDFTLGTRLLSEARIVADYIQWTFLPTPEALSFYHDDFVISTGLLTPPSTLASIVFLAMLLTLVFWLRIRRPLIALGIALFFGCQLLTGTIIPLELIYEHRNYFASFGLLLAVVPLLLDPDAASLSAVAAHAAHNRLPQELTNGSATPNRAEFFRPTYVLLTGLILFWAAMTAMTAYSWGDPLRLAEELAARSPRSPRAQYEVGRTYIIYSQYQPTSQFVEPARRHLEIAANLPGSSILPEQALIFFNARMRLPLSDAWWDSMIAKLKSHQPTVQDESSLAALTECVRHDMCDLPQSRMIEAFLSALGHPKPDARLLANYSDYAWNVLDDHELGARVAAEAVNAEPSEPAYRITQIRMLVALGRKSDAIEALRQLESLNIGGRLDQSLAELRKLPGL
jgi:hypothetical protein